jgi:hypothetical protein
MRLGCVERSAGICKSARMLRAIGLSKRCGVGWSILVGGVWLAAACASKDREFSGANEAAAGEAGAAVTGASGGDAGESQAVGGDSRGGGSNGSSGAGNGGTSNEDGGAPPLQDDAPTVVSVSPDDRSDDATPAVSVKITFSQALKGDTATKNSVKLFDGDLEVEGDVHHANGVVTFTPVDNLSLNATYRLEVSTAVTNVGGKPLKAPFGATFQVRDGVWSATHADLAPNNGAVTQVSSGADGHGNLLFAWVQDGTMAARWYHSGIGWDPTAEALDSGVVASPAVAVSPEGDAVVAWTSGANYMAKRCLSHVWEGTAKKLGTVTGTIKPPVASIRNARALVAWPVGTANGTHFTWSTYANSASGEGAWQAQPTQVWATTVDNLSVRDPSLKQAASGDGFLVFELAKTTFRQLYFATFADADASWSTANGLEGATGLVTDTGQGYSLAVADAGDALVAWALPGKLMAARYTIAKGFATPIEIDGLASDPLVAVAGGAQAAGDDFWVGWTQIDGAPSNAYVNHYVATDKAWSGAERLSDGAASARPPQVGVDRHGNVLAAWLQPAAPKAPAVAARFSGGKWAKPVTLYSGNDLLTTVGICTAGSGQAAALLAGAEATSVAFFE